MAVQKFPKNPDLGHRSFKNGSAQEEPYLRYPIASGSAADKVFSIRGHLYPGRAGLHDR